MGMALDNWAANAAAVPEPAGAAGRARVEPARDATTALAAAHMSVPLALAPHERRRGQQTTSGALIAGALAMSRLVIVSSRVEPQNQSRSPVTNRAPPVSSPAASARSAVFPHL